MLGDLFMEEENFHEGSAGFYGFCDSGVILKKSGQHLSFSVKSEVLTRG